jgi:hypothetical protein
MEFSCEDSEDSISVGRTEGSGIIRRDRAFLDFDTSAIPPTATIEQVEIAFGIDSGMTQSTPVEIKQMTSPASGYTGPWGCNTLFASINATTLYVTEPNWQGTGVSKTVDLGEDAKADLQAQLDSETGWFSVGLKLEDEGTEDLGTLYNVMGAIPNKIRVIYTP